MKGSYKLVKRKMDHIENTGQDNKVWTDAWQKLTPESEIKMWDFYGGRQWITKYTPRNGKTLEAGCGLGRYVFYLSQMGIEIEGLDFSEATINFLNQWKVENHLIANFLKGDVTSLPYPDNSLSGYISLGVVEHFIEGPQKPIAEAFRTLRPGGIAMITTPNISFLVIYRNVLRKFKNIVKKIIGREIIAPPFFQYEYTPLKLKSFLQQQGFYVSRSEACDLLYPFCEMGGFTGENLRKGKFPLWFADTFENTWLKRFGAQSITISVKKAPVMYCFISGELSATPDSLEKFDVPVSKEYQNSDLAKLFLKGKKVKYAESYEIDPPILKTAPKICEYTGNEYITDNIFENFGFNKNASPEVLIKPEVNIELCVKHIKPAWRKRK